MDTPELLRLSRVLRWRSERLLRVGDGEMGGLLRSSADALQAAADQLVQMELEVIGLEARMRSCPAS